MKKDKINNQNFRFDIHLTSYKKYNFSKENSKNIRPFNIYRKLPYKNYNTCKTISSDSKCLVNNNSAILKIKIKKKLSTRIKKNCSYLCNKRKMNNIFNKSYITEDKIKVKTIKDLIKKRKIALGLIDNCNLNINKTP